MALDHCPKCGYDLSAHARVGRCPQCDRPFDRAVSAPPRRKREHERDLSGVISYVVGIVFVLLVGLLLALLIGSQRPLYIGGVAAGVLALGLAVTLIKSKH